MNTTLPPVVGPLISADVVSHDWPSTPDPSLREFWDHRVGITEHEVRVVLQTVQHGSNGPNHYSGRRLIPTLPFRLAVCGSYVAIVGAALWNVINVWESRGELPLASDFDAAVDRFGPSAIAFVVAVCAVRVAQGCGALLRRGTRNAARSRLRVSSACPSCS